MKTPVGKIKNWLILIIVFLSKMIGLVLILYGSYSCVRNYWRAFHSKNYTGCIWNCMKIGRALEIYSNDHDGHYPPALSLLLPKYLKSIPTCPAAKTDTYSSTYNTTSNAEAFTFYCMGHHHREVGFEPNFPQYNSINGRVNNQFDTKNNPLDSLIYAIRLKNLASIKKIIDKNPGMVEVKGGDGRTVLSEAVSWNRKDVIELLISRGVDVNSATNSGWTPLHSALSSNGRKDMAEFLISKGADVNGELNGWTHLHRAVNRGDNDIVKFLLRSGASVNARNKDNHTPLYYAMKKGRKDIIKLLREHGARQ
ncbi:MAG: ankyrin repeat domain-containing protein [Candidatus Eremiobacteraeota bacterium]|nr:ankyrin repeat domain-containing protein [Candidatus Eremiobacteraeota bacterium]